MNGCVHGSKSKRCLPQEHKSIGPYPVSDRRLAIGTRLTGINPGRLTVISRPMLSVMQLLEQGATQFSYVTARRDITSTMDVERVAWF